MTDRRLYASCSIDLAPGWAAETRVDFDAGERTEYLPIIPENNDALLRIIVFNPQQRGIDAARWVEFVGQSNRAKGRPVSAVQCGEFSGYALEFQECEEWLRGWALRAGAVPLDATYRCNVDNAGRDHSAVDSMLNTLRFDNPGE